jgi:hypothetical protein
MPNADRLARTSLVFIKVEDGRTLPHYVSATDLAGLLAGYGVGHIVLNACQSADYSTSSSNVAKVLVQRGAKIGYGDVL